MLKWRKLLVWLVAFVLVVAAYLAYNRLVDTPAIRVRPDQQDTAEFDVPDLGAQSAKIGEAVVGTVEKSEYVDLDDNKNVKRVFGFARLLNPDAGTEEWTLQKPYMEIYEQAVRYEIVSDRGTCRVETVAGNPSPTSAHLIDNVKIHVLPTSADGPPKTTIHLDDLFYDSERSEFKTDGPIKIISQEGRMEGEGMLLIYNNALGRVEYLKIKDLDYLHLKDISLVSSKASAKSSRTSSAPAVAKVEPSPSPSPPESTSSEQRDHTPVIESDKASVPPADNVPSGGGEEVQGHQDDYYVCRFERDVVITYGMRIMAEGADEVTISNILFSGWQGKGESVVSEADSTDTERAPDNETVLRPAAPEASYEAVVPADPAAKESTSSAVGSGPKKTAPESTDDDTVDVYITCKGGITIQPVTSILSTTDATSRVDKSTVIELVGRPISVRQIAAAQPESAITIARCSMLKYDLDSDIMDMFTSDHQPSIFLSLADSEAQLETTGSVKWDRKADKATITGPGRLSIPSTKKHVLQDKTSTQMNFNGVMHVFFARHRPADSLHELDLRSVNLLGGMAAAMGDGQESHMSAESATFFFDEASDITRADLAGAVNFSSEKGRLNSQRAKVLFATDTTGRTRPVTVRGMGKATLTPAAARNSERPARFSAKKIDYDMEADYAFATGPVMFTFYASNPDYTGADPEPVPVVITADDNAEFFGDQNRIVFNGSVVGSRRTQTPAYLQTSTFRGQKLIVDLAQTQPDSTDVRHVTVVGGKVRLESVRSVDEKTINHVRLSCRRIDYEASDEIVTATGPGDIQINNENAPPPDKEEADKKISLQRPCYAFIEGFDKLRWFTTDNRITADGKTKSVNMNYLPLVEGKWGQVIRSAATHIEANFTEVASGRSELTKLRTTGGVSYREVGGNEFIGDSLFYDVGKSLMSVTGSEMIECQLNGTFFDEIEYDLATGKAKGLLASKPGILPRRAKRRNSLSR